jgi:hypothetical protein
MYFYSYKSVRVRISPIEGAIFVCEQTLPGPDPPREVPLIHSALIVSIGISTHPMHDIHVPVTFMMMMMVNLKKITTRVSQNLILHKNADQPKA